MTVKPILSVAEVAGIFGLTVQQTLRRLKKRGVVRGTGRGKKIDVPLKKLMERMKDEWESAVLAARFGGENVKVLQS